jgi:hopene-associated glycosyltransferase HpnB
MSGVLAVICAAIWAYLIGARGRYWLGSVRDVADYPRPSRWPAVTAVVPARNEADLIGRSIGSLLRQDYPGPFRIVLVDDDSSDRTADAALRAAAANPDRPFRLVATQGPPAEWTGKLWALKQGIDAAAEAQPDYLLLTDADIEHAPDTVSWLVTKSLAGPPAVLISLMAKLRCVSFAERSHVPAFVYFFQMLFPFSWVGRGDASTAAAAGGCMLIRTEALTSVGGIGSVRNALIDDCALAAMLKVTGAIWLGLTDRVRSLRSYPTLATIRQMIVRSAYAQLHFSPLLLIGAIAAMALTFQVPVLLAVVAHGWPRLVGLAVWLAMAVSFVPTLRFYRLSPLWGLALPAIAALYQSYTLESAYRHLRRRGGEWKGRFYANAARLP